mmetsp:Transcript_18354/g.51149  ORF Transcript_18354/g.51149 Transcript_18354/m.51149 type:complete len:265 (-) Transcript_18354:259-1053(-)
MRLVAPTTTILFQQRSSALPLPPADRPETLSSNAASMAATGSTLTSASHSSKKIRPVVVVAAGALASGASSGGRKCLVVRVVLESASACDRARTTRRNSHSSARDGDPGFLVPDAVAPPFCWSNSEPRREHTTVSGKALAAHETLKVFPTPGAPERRKLLGTSASVLASRLPLLRMHRSVSTKRRAAGLGGFSGSALSFDLGGCLCSGGSSVGGTGTGTGTKHCSCRMVMYVVGNTTQKSRGSEDGHPPRLEFVAFAFAFRCAA